MLQPEPNDPALEETDPGLFKTRGGQEPPLPPPGILDRSATQELPIGNPVRPVALVSKRPPVLRLVLGATGLVLLALTGGLFCLRTRPMAYVQHAWQERQQKAVPPALRAYYDKAVLGDATAMRMLGTMYYNGLNVPRDTSEGIRWYRKAAAAGSVAARKDMEQLGLSATGK